MKDFGQYVLAGIGIFALICLITVLFTWCGHRKDKDTQLYPDGTGSVVMMHVRMA